MIWVELAAAAAAKSLQSCPTLRDPIDGSPPGSPVPGILKARTLERVAISFSNAGKWEVKGKSLSHVQLFATPRTAAHQASWSMGFSKQEYWSGVPLPSPWVELNGHYFFFSQWRCLHVQKNITNTGMLPCSVKWKPNNFCWQGKTPSLLLRFLE